MKIFTKLALVSSIAISANAMAMQSMDDAALSATTGQDGISIGIALDGGSITIGQVFMHDNGGLAASGQAGDAGYGGTATSGSIVIGKAAIAATGNDPAIPGQNGITITQTDPNANLVDLVIDSDAGTGTNGAFLNIAASLGGMTVDIGSIGVGKSGTRTAGSVVRGVTAGSVNEILTGLSLTLGNVDATIQLGATPQGAMIVLDTEIAGGIVLEDLGIKDNARGGTIHLDEIQLVTTGQTYLNGNAKIGVTTTGLEIKPVAQNVSAYIAGVRLGSSAAASIGDIELQGLNMGGSTITISGH